MKFDTNELLEVDDVLYECEEDNIVDTTRWSEIHEIVFKKDGKFWQGMYSCGATESQDEHPWEYEDEVTCREVEKKEVLVKKWVPVCS